MTRSQCDTLSENIVRIYSEMEDEILRKIAAQIGRDGNVSDTSKWRIRQLARSGKMNASTASLIASYTDTQSEMVFDTVMTAAVNEIAYLDAAVQAANRKGVGDYFSDIPAEESALSAMQAFRAQAESDLNLVNTVMQYKAKSAYVDAINGIYYDASKRQERLDDMGVGAASAVSGQMSLQEATRSTIRRMAQKGIPAFVDKRSREWSPEAYVMMDMRSTLANTARAAQNKRCDEYGIQLIEVSSHMGARPKCAPYQGRIFSRDGSSGSTVDGIGNRVTYTPLSSTSFGEPDGLFGINCGHVQYPFIPGITSQTYYPYNREANAERYKEFQRQRAMERDIRATKRECMMLQAAGDEEGLQAASQRLRKQKEKYSQYCKDTGLGSHLDRTQVYGYDRSKSAKTVWAERKAQSGGNGGNTTPSSGHAVEVNINGGSNGGTGKLYQDIPLTKGVKNGTIKSIDVDDFNLMAGSHAILPEVSELIVQTIKSYEKQGGMYISDMHFGSFVDTETGKAALMQVFQTAFGLTEININSDIMGGKTISEIDMIIRSVKLNLPHSLKEAVIHECGHAKAYYRKKPSEVEQMNKELSTMGVEGISAIAKRDGAECIAEVEVLLSRNAEIPDEAMALYNKYVRKK